MVEKTSGTYDIEISADGLDELSISEAFNELGKRMQQAMRESIDQEMAKYIDRCTPRWSMQYNAEPTTRYIGPPTPKAEEIRPMDTLAGKDLDSFGQNMLGLARIVESDADYRARLRAALGELAPAKEQKPAMAIIGIALESSKGTVAVSLTGRSVGKVRYLTAPGETFRPGDIVAMNDQGLAVRAQPVPSAPPVEAYTWQNITISFDGQQFEGVTSIEYSDSPARGKMMGVYVDEDDDSNSDSIYDDPEDDPVPHAPAPAACAKCGAKNEWGAPANRGADFVCGACRAASKLWEGR